MRISKYYGLNIYNSKGRYVGIVNDIVLDFQNGEVFGLAVGQERGLENIAVSYNDVLAVGDIVIVKAMEEKKE
ncbi:MAG: PRC-barrel domain-containing protein [Methanomicrobia archaeon]|jgi:sporulation protein YlmC with PRC-barrel domain|nr:PRC-barrel domain-containing protein [Methanomicrobia archaeon]MCK4310826.1 PRC-barrel domain-containing protein [Methanomicrobia archaeon]MCK4432923.1 PRC-barrel domain-containing protein [Methanomicrobia archaeon]MCK4636943.1 PRC-barrel domain-containing protein [Methanomicrobia archaeon]